MLAHSSLPPKAQARRVLIYKARRAARPDIPAEAHWQGALAEMHFRDKLAADVKAIKKRSAAAKRGWAKRRGQA